jgi:HicB family
MRKSNFALRLQPSLLDEARRIAEEEGVALNQLINVAVAEKLSAIRTEAFFRERAHRANIPEAIEILEKLGRGNPPMKGDELPNADRLYISGGSHTGGPKRAKARTSRTRR